MQRQTELNTQRVKAVRLKHETNDMQDIKT